MFLRKIVKNKIFRLSTDRDYYFHNGRACVICMENIGRDQNFSKLTSVGISKIKEFSVKWAEVGMPTNRQIEYKFILNNNLICQKILGLDSGLPNQENC